MRGKVVHLRAADETEALALVFKEYGRDAIVGEIRQVRKAGLAGLMGQKEVEVSVRVKPQTNEGDVEKFRALINTIGQSIRAEQGERYFKQWEVALKKFDIGGSLAEKLISGVGNRPYDPETLAQRVAAAIPVRKEIPRVLALVGPTGTGKTTIAAKLAGMHGCQLGKKVAIITLDTSRIGAVEQLRIYTRIMGIPFSVVSTPGEFKEVMAQYAKHDYVFIDTPGRAPGNLLSLSEIEAFLSEWPGLEVALVVSATTKLRDLLIANKGYSKLRPSCLVINKVDETSSLGSVVTFVHQCNLPLICIGTGQNVPQDMQFATGKLVFDWVSSVNNPYTEDMGGAAIGRQIG